MQPGRANCLRDNRMMAFRFPSSPSPGRRRSACAIWPPNANPDAGDRPARTRHRKLWQRGSSCSIGVCFSPRVAPSFHARPSSACPGLAVASRRIACRRDAGREDWICVQADDLSCQRTTRRMRTGLRPCSKQYWRPAPSMSRNHAVTGRQGGHHGIRHRLVGLTSVWPQLAASCAAATPAPKSPWPAIPRPNTSLTPSAAPSP
jgi:hypothetical protein